MRGLFRFFQLVVKVLILFQQCGQCLLNCCCICGLCSLCQGSLLFEYAVDICHMYGYRIGKLAGFQMVKPANVRLTAPEADRAASAWPPAVPYSGIVASGTVSASVNVPVVANCTSIMPVLSVHGVADIDVVISTLSAFVLVKAW